ncbi:MAG TPA: glucose 1-dehydrogenase [Solirubrobacteraceae bacterium]|jgi:NAD(P)-dependent dehydrogenase (short-subunit alcohol dehydrogenase family)|nr:glucose 1-dehydrogenase [Solirubrobacteraceae bacterium]
MAQPPIAAAATTAPGAGADLLNRFRLDGRVAIVTGASSGLGVEFARGLAACGADVVIMARRAERLERTCELVRQTGTRCVAARGDVTDTEDCRRTVEVAVEAFGRVDVLVNNAGVASAAPASREPISEFAHVLDVNVTGAYRMAQACARVMQPGSAIVNIGSVIGSRTAALPQAAYAASKAAIIGLTRDLAQQWSGRKGIRVNALAPGFFPTEMTDEYLPGYLEQEILPRIPIGRAGDLPELTAALLFLASDASSYVTGVLLPVDGGFLT